MKFLGQIVITSTDTTNSNISNARFTLQNRINGVGHIAVKQIQLLNLQYDIPASSQLSYTFNATPHTVLFTTSYGQFTASSLCSYLQTQMRAQTSSATLTVTYDSITDLITFATGNASTMQLVKSPTAGSTIYRQLGVVMPGNTSYYDYPVSGEATTFTLPYPVMLPRTQYFDFCSNELTRYNTASATTGRSGRVVYRLPNNLAFGSLLYEDAKYPSKIKYDSTSQITDIDIQILNDDGSTAELNNSVWSMTLDLYQ